ncbi:hypothetical protein GQ44DRAFT_778365 [Phaeosphaeriaceae sp. PMI808]|nr:hypothetical protein GQ44DRAFT_778365 [Phaeosphaeriaceae sp. PMI808]
MPQHRLEHYFVPAKPPFVPSGRSFIDLPYSIRKLVYKYAELDNILVDLNYANLKVYPEGTYPETQGCRKLTAQDGPYELKKLDVAESEDVWEIDCGSEDIPSYWRSVWGIPYGLHQSMLLVSRQIHEEVEAFTCAGSVFRVCLGQPLGFTRLHRLSDNALSNLGSLTIRLDIPKTVVYFNGWAESPTPLEYIDLSTRWGQIVLKSWKLAIDRLIQSVRPGQLRLHVIFYAMTEADASALIEPMMRLPLLKDCGIRADIYGQDHWRKSYSDDFGYSVFTAAFCETLYHYPRPTNVDTALSRHVQKAIQKLTFVRDVDPAPFRYLDLPQELRFAILEFTDLVSPNADEQ